MHLIRTSSINDLMIVRDMTSPTISLPHTFRLKNMSSAEVRITSTSTSCSCTDVVCSRKLVPPGEELEVSATLRATSAAVKHERIWLVVEGGQPVVLSLRGDFRSSVFAFPDRSSVDLVAKDADSFNVILRRYDDSVALPSISVLNDAGMKVSVGEWRRLWSPTPLEPGPPRWFSRIEVSRTPSANVVSAETISIGVEGAAPIDIRTNGSPFR